MKFFIKLFMVCLVLNSSNSASLNKDQISLESDKVYLEDMDGQVLKKNSELDNNSIQIENNQSSDNNREELQKQSRKLAEKFYTELLLILLENDLSERFDESDVYKVRIMRNLVDSKLRSYNFFFDEKARPIKKPMKNEHRHMFIGKRNFDNLQF